MATDESDFATFQARQGYEVRDDPEYAALAAALRDAVEGEVRFDEYAQVRYASDGSIYEAKPAGVVIPRSVADVQAAVRIAADHDTPVLPRGAGSSLAGQAVGPGCLVLDFSKYMDSILDVDPAAKRATVEPGVVQDDLDDRLADHDLKFAPDPASSNRATIGGGIGNNSTGAHSVRYGITDAYTEELDVVLVDGSLVHTREVVLDSEEWDEIVAQDDLEAVIYRTVRGLVEDNQAEIEARYPDLKRRVSGYNLDRVIYETAEGERAINLSKLLVGAEGTLGIVVSATLSLVSKPAETALVLYCFEDLLDAMRAVPVALAYDVSAVELMDETVFRLARESSEFAEYAEPIPEGTAAALLLEYDSERHDDFGTAIGATDERFLEEGAAFDSIEAHEADAQDNIWKLRKAAIPLLMSMEGDPKPYPFIEDATVPPEALAEYVQSFEDVLAAHDTSAAYFAHAGAGTLHIRPILDLKTGDGVETMQSIAEDVTDLVLEHHGSFSGEHGDGLARTQFNPKMYGEDLWAAFKTLKSTFDPDWRLNPGTVVYRDEDPTDMREALRYGPTYESIEPATTLDFSDEGGYAHLVELCNGCGTCRQTDAETMCPTYRAAKDEAVSTRGRANMLRAAINGDLGREELYTERFQQEVLDLCIGCKGCKNDCPTGVDLAKLKAETKHQYHEREGTSPRERFFANIDRYAALGSTLAPLSNLASRLPGAGTVLESFLGIAPERSLPRFAGETFLDWFAAREPQVERANAEHSVVLFPDTYTKYVHPEIGEAAVRVLKAAGVHVAVPDGLAPSGRAAFSQGFLEQARERARQNVDLLSVYVDAGFSVVAVEPADAVMFQDEYRDLLDDEAVETVSDAAYGLSEFLDTHRLDESLAVDPSGASFAYHGHCNQKAVNTDHHAANLLGRLGFDVDALDSGCCGMAGSFGYEAEHYDLSKAIGRILFDKVAESESDTVIAPGASCRTQLADEDDGDGERPPHPIELIDEALAY